MKKMFGVLSLIAIFTVAFTSQASANDSPDTQVVYDIGNVDRDFVTVSVELVVEGEVFYVYTVGSDLRSADETVKELASVEDLSESVNLVNGYFVLTNFDNEFYIRGKEPIRCVNSIITFDIRGKEPIRYANNETIKENSCPVKSVTDIYSDAERPVGWC